LRKAGNLSNRYAWLDALHDWIMDHEEYFWMLDDTMELGADLEEFLESKHPGVLREFEEKYEKDRKEAEDDS